MEQDRGTLTSPVLAPHPSPPNRDSHRELEPEKAPIAISTERSELDQESQSITELDQIPVAQPALPINTEILTDDDIIPLQQQSLEGSHHDTIVSPALFEAHGNSECPSVEGDDELTQAFSELAPVTSNGSPNTSQRRMVNFSLEISGVKVQVRFRRARWRCPRPGTTFFGRNYRPRLLLAEIVQSRQIRLRDLRPHRYDAKGVRVEIPACLRITLGPASDPIDIQKVFGARRQLE